jgi:hypothetical protein
MAQGKASKTMLDAANASWREIFWSVGALFGLLFTVGMAVWAWGRFRVVQQAVISGSAVVWGPRWNLTLGLFVAMVLFSFGWCGYLGLGIVAMLTPEPAREASQDAADWFASILVGMEVSHALGQTALLLAFMSLSGMPRWVRRAVAWRPA